MKLIFLSIIGAVGASAAVVDAPSNGTSPSAPQSAAACADRIEQVRDQLAQPKLDRSPATPEQGHLIAAVDKRIDGCAVMQMHGRIDDLRPLPQPILGPARLLPAR